MTEVEEQKLTNEEIGRLAMYNSEVARGIMHTPEWKLQMQALQERFDAQRMSKSDPHYGFYAD